MTADFVAQVRLQFTRQERTWFEGLAYSLETTRRGLSVVWAARCFMIITDRRYPHRREAFSQYLSALGNPLQTDRGAPAFLDDSMDIWLTPGRDATQTSLSKLYGAIGNFYAGENPYRNASYAIHNLLYDDWPDGTEWHSDSQALFEIALTVHNAIIDEYAQNGT